MRSNLNTTAITTFCAFVIRTNVICTGMLRAILAAEHQEHQPSAWRKQAYPGMKFLAAMFAEPKRGFDPARDTGGALLAVSSASGSGRVVCLPAAATGDFACFG